MQKDEREVESLGTEKTRTVLYSEDQTSTVKGGILANEIEIYTGLVEDNI